jgi:hypothetical protein
MLTGVIGPHEERRQRSGRCVLALDRTGDALELTIQPKESIGRSGKFPSTARTLAVLTGILGGDVFHHPLVEPSHDGLVTLVIYQDVSRSLGHVEIIGVSGAELERRPVASTDRTYR